MQRTWAVAPVAAVTVLAAQLAAPAASSPAADLSTPAAMDVALAAVEQAVSWQCDLPHRTAAERIATQRAMRSNDPTPTIASPVTPAAGPNPRPIPGFGGDPGQNPRVKVNGGFPSGAAGADVYQVPLRAGEVFSATVRGSAGTLEVRDPKGVLVEGSSVDRSGIYPPASPLLGGGNATVDHVAAVNGIHTITVRPAKPGSGASEPSDESGASGGSTGTSGGSTSTAPGSPAPTSPAPRAAAPGSPVPTSPAPGSPAPGSPAPGSPVPGGPAAAGDEPDGTVPDPAQVPAPGSAAAPSNAAVDAGPRVLPPAALDAPTAKPDQEPSTAPTPNAAGPGGSVDPDSGDKSDKDEKKSGDKDKADKADKKGKNTEPAGGPAAVNPSEVAAPPGAPPASDPRAYQVDMGIFRPVRSAAQKIVLEFGGAAIDTRKFGLETANNDVKLSPLSTFLPRFGLTAADQPALMKRVVDTVRENLSAAAGGGPVDVTAAEKPDASTFGKPGVSRVVVGGSSTEAGISTVGIAESVDPGNFAQEETALVLLDKLSGPVDRGPNGNPVALSNYLPLQAARSVRIEFVARSLGNIASHEAGHFLGSWHTDPKSGRHDLMAPGDVIGAFGLGPDRQGITADDARVRFGQDTFDPDLGFYGTEDTRNRTLVGLRGMPSPS
jgi:hypothetical protein